MQEVEDVWWESVLKVDLVAESSHNQSLPVNVWWVETYHEKCSG